jgi:hypothetical protein
LSSPDLMLVAAGGGALSVVSLLVGRNIINRPTSSDTKLENPPFCGPTLDARKEKTGNRVAAAR